MSNAMLKDQISQKSLEMKIFSDPSLVLDVRKALEEFARNAGLSQSACDDVGLTINEVLANIIRHGYDGRHDQPITITAESSPGEVRLSVRDWAKPFDSERAMPKRLPSSAGDLTPGGLGLIC